MKVLVTGGAGFIGSHVTELLCDKGVGVIVVDDLSSGFNKFVDKRAKFVKASIGNEKLMASLLKKVDVVIHLAASSIIKSSYERPLEYFENNVVNGVKLLEAMRKAGVKKIINSSTAAVYGEPKRVPIKEEDAKNPISPYGVSKLAFENALSAYYHSFGIESVSLRYFNAYGPRDEQKPASRAVAIWIKAALKGKPLPLYWKGEQIRDYVYVGDIARVHLEVMNIGGINFFNIGSGNGIKMRDVLSALEEIVGKKLKVVDKGERRGDPQKLYADISKIKKEVGWRPKVSLQEGLSKTFEYYKSVYRKDKK